MAADDKNQANNDKTTRKPGVVIPRRVTPDAKPASMPEPGDSPALVRHKARVAAAEAAQAGAPAATKAEPERIARADLAPYQTSVRFRLMWSIRRTLRTSS